MWWRLVIDALTKNFTTVILAKPYHLDEWLWVNLYVNYVSPTLTTSKFVTLSILMKKKKLQSP